MPIVSLYGPSLAAFEREGVPVEKVVDGDLALVLDVGVAARDRVLVECDLAEPVRGLGGLGAYSVVHRR